MKLKIFRPVEILDRYDEFNIKKYQDLGIKTILLDIDNTIAIPDVGSCDQRAKDFIEELQKNFFKVYIFSNNTKKRVEQFIDGVDVDFIYLACKPLPFSYWKACKLANCKTNETLIIGDQLLTDILGANLSGCLGIYTKQLQEKDTLFTSINRKIEKTIWRMMDEKM